MNKIVEILIQRDNMTTTEAENYLDEVREMADEAIKNGDYFELEEILRCELALEPDYIFDLMGF